MIKDSYNLLGVNEYDSDAEIESKYQQLIAKYREERFLDGEAGNQAAKNLNDVQVAYAEILEYRRERGGDNDNSLFAEIDKAIRSDDLKTAQEKLDSFNERTAEWHYLQAVVFYRKKWTNESKKQLEIAIKMDADNTKYKEAYEKLVKNNMSSSASANKGSNNSNASSSQNTDSDWNRSGSSGGNSFNDNTQNFNSSNQQQMGGSGCLDFCCQMLACNMLLNCCCGNCG